MKDRRLGPKKKENDKMSGHFKLFLRFSEGGFEEHPSFLTNGIGGLRPEVEPVRALALDDNSLTRGLGNMPFFKNRNHAEGQQVL